MAKGPTLSGEAPNIRRLIRLATEALLAEQKDVDTFLAGIGEYLTSLEEWRTKFAEVSPTEEVDAETRAALTELNEIHQKLLQGGDQFRKKLTQEMGDNKKKASALRAYVDRFPQRITIAGKRKG